MPIAIGEALELVAAAEWVRELTLKLFFAWTLNQLWIL